jgi:WD40 repeat protein
MKVLEDGSLASCSADSFIRIWNINNGKTTRVLNGHGCRVTCLAVLQDSSLASGSDDKTVRIWNLKSLNEHNFSDEFSS